MTEQLEQTEVTERETPIEGEVVHTESREMILNSDRNGVLVGSSSVNGFRGVIAKASEIATVLQEIIVQRKLFKRIGNKDFVICEGWTTLGAMLGTCVRVVSTVESETVKGEFISVVEAIRTKDGMVIGQANASCGPDEAEWKKRSRQACRSMSETRATGKVLRLLYSWVMQLAGYEVVPAEEMSEDDPPPPNPHQRPGAPRTAPRDERITADELDAFFKSWKDWRATNDQPDDVDDLMGWISNFTHPPARVTRTDSWDRQTMDRCLDELVKEKEAALAGGY